MHTRVVSRGGTSHGLGGYKPPKYRLAPTVKILIKNQKVNCAKCCNFYYPNVTTLRSSLCYRKSVCRQLSVCNIGAPYTQVVEAFGIVAVGRWVRLSLIHI